MIQEAQAGILLLTKDREYLNHLIFCMNLLEHCFVLWLDKRTWRKWIASLAREQEAALDVGLVFIGNLECKLRDDAANGPYVCFGAVVCAEDDFW